MKNKNLFLISFIYFITMMLFVLLRFASSAGFFDKLPDAWANVTFSVIIQVGIMFLVPITLLLLIFKKGVKNTFSSLGFKKISLNSVGIAILIGVLAFFLNLIVSTVFNGLIGFFGYNPTSSGNGATYDTFLKFLQALLLVAVLPAVFEEIMHRGVLLKGYQKEIGVKRALIYSSLLFGLMHLNVGQVFYATIMGALIGVTVIVSGSIFPAMIVHFINNAINIYLVYAAQNSLFGQNFYENINNFLQSNNPLFTFLSSFLFLGFLVLFIAMLLIKLFKENTVNKLEAIKQKVEKGLDEEVFFGEGEPLEGAEIAAVNMVLVEKLKPLLPDFSKIHSPMDIFVPSSEEDKVKPSKLDNLFYYASVFLGVLVTIFTFIWGVV
jgi:membrane protease YdiL (CAAX protease family)